MSNEIIDVAVVPESERELDQMIGERRAFSRVSDSCSAADAELLRRMRDERLYRLKGQNWGEFCNQHLQLSKSEANRIIQRFQEFGQAYFDVSRIVRISPESFRAIAPAVKDNAIEWNGERIPLSPENSKRIAAAVQAIREEAQKPAGVPRKIAAPGSVSYRKRLEEINDKLREISDELQHICEIAPEGSIDRYQLKQLAVMFRESTRGLKNCAGLR
jgi:hypothetical protein